MNAPAAYWWNPRRATIHNPGRTPWFTFCGHDTTRMTPTNDPTPDTTRCVRCFPPGAHK